MARNRSGTTFTKEQLQNMGCVGKDMPQSQNQICPTFPILMSKCYKLETSAARDYKIVWKEGFQTYMHECFSSSERGKLKDDSYSMKVATSIEKERKKNLKIQFAWNLMPQELRPTNKRKAGPSAKPNIKSKKPKTTEEIESKLKMLEEKESKERGEDEAEVKVVGSDDENEEMEEDEKAEHEPEDDLDYGNNYFDNGEDYENVDEDDDGPTY